MTTTRKAIERITEATGLPPATVTYAARYLADAGLWPKGKRGGHGVNAALADARDCVNLLIALGAARQIKAAPEAVKKFSGLKRIKLQNKKNRNVREYCPDWDNETFFNTLLKIVMMEEKNKEKLQDIEGLYFDNTNNVATITIKLNGIENSSSSQIRFGVNKKTPENRPIGEARQITEFAPGIFTVIAGIHRDTMIARRKGK